MLSDYCDQEKKDCNKKVGDTLIEKKFMEKCETCLSSELGNYLQSDWVHFKRLYKDELRTIEYIFANYTLHDASHSETILKNISRLLGDRVDKLSVGDLWLLLNTAYSHDIGMAVKAEEMKKWFCSNNDSEGTLLAMMNEIGENNTYIDESLSTAIEHYRLIAELIRYGSVITDEARDVLKKLKDSGVCWPVQIRKDINVIISSYVRKIHHERSERFFSEEFFSENKFQEPRLYKLIGQIDALHGKNFEDIMKEDVAYRCNGFIENDWIHPKFIAVLLRIGDLLDIDNLRYSNALLDYQGELPEESKNHIKKHKAVCHLAIDSDRVEVTSRSDSLEVCKLSFAWFKAIDEEFENLIMNWGTIAPKNLGGCFLIKPYLKVFYNDEEYINENSSNFDFDSKKALNLFIGNNIYNTELDAIREYVQNALDASKVQMWYDIVEDKKYNNNEYLNNSEINLKEITPFDIKEELYQKYKIRVRLEEDEDKEYFNLFIQDRGIGIDNEGVKCMQQIGKGWRGRKVHNKAIQAMPSWLRPTGGFGIGVQSAFMLCDETEMRTKSQSSPGLCLRLCKNKFSNSINQVVDRKITRQGTEVKLRIKYDDIAEMITNEKFLSFAKINNEEKTVFEILDINRLQTETQGGSDIPNFKTVLASRLEYIYNGIYYYLKCCFFNTLIPIYFTVEKNGKKNRKRIIISNQYHVIQEKTNKIRTLKKGKVVDYLFEEDSKKFFVWEKLNQLYVVFSFDNTTSSRSNKKRGYFYPGYKNVLVPDDFQLNNKCFEFTDIMLDVLGISVKECLVVSRNKFLNEFDALKKVQDIFMKGIKESIENEDFEILKFETKNDNMQQLLQHVFVMNVLEGENIDLWRIICNQETIVDKEFDNKLLNSKGNGLLFSENYTTQVNELESQGTSIRKITEEKIELEDFTSWSELLTKILLSEFKRGDERLVVVEGKGIAFIKDNIKDIEMQIYKAFLCDKKGYVEVSGKFESILSLNFVPYMKANSDERKNKKYIINPFNDKEMTEFQVKSELLVNDKIKLMEIIKTILENPEKDEIYKYIVNNSSLRKGGQIDEKKVKEVYLEIIASGMNKYKEITSIKNNEYKKNENEME